MCDIGQNLDGCGPKAESHSTLVFDTGRRRYQLHAVGGASGLTYRPVSKWQRDAVQALAGSQEIGHHGEIKQELN